MPIGIYISVPFCRSKCSYCNFASGVFPREMAAAYVERVCGDVSRAQHIAASMGGMLERQTDSIYLGGGTPTTLSPQQLERIFATVRQEFDVDPAAEITVECAPGSLVPEVLDALVRCGVDRVSLGVQSFVNAEAAAVGRLHNREQVLDDISRLRAAGISNINVDLIAGLPRQTPASWRASLDDAVTAPHVSVYMLEVDDESRLGRELIAGGARYHAHFVPDEDATADSYLQACGRLDSAGIAQYEISNFARPGMESHHNLKYWRRQPYIGFGLNAHSMLEASPEPYDTLREASAMVLPEGGCSPCAAAGADLDAVRFSTADSLDGFMAGAPLQWTAVSGRAALEETFFLGLRLNRGVDLKQVGARFAVNVETAFGETIRELESYGVVERDHDTLRLTPAGRLVSNEVFERFIALPAEL